MDLGEFLLNVVIGILAGIGFLVLAALTAFWDDLDL